MFENDNIENIIKYIILLLIHELITTPATIPPTDPVFVNAPTDEFLISVGKISEKYTNM